MSNDCYVNVENDLIEAQFLGVFQCSNVLEPSIMRGGHNGGVVAYPVAVVKMQGGLREVRLSDVTFKR